MHLAGDHIDGQRINLTWPNLNKKISKLPLTHFILNQCTALLISSDMFRITNKIKKKIKKIYHTLGTDPKPNTKIVERGKITQIHDFHDSQDIIIHSHI